MLLEKIEKWCRENNSSVSALEKSCGLGNATIRAWATSRPRVDTLQKVACEMGIPIEKLLGAADDICDEGEEDEK